MCYKKVMEKTKVLLRKINLVSKKTIYISLLSCVLLPPICLANYSARKEVGIICGVVASCMAWALLRFWEKKMQRIVEQLVRAKVEKIQELPSEKSIQQEKEIQQLHLEMEKKREKMRAAYLEFEDLRKEHQNLEEELKRQRVELQGYIKQKEALLSEYQKTIGEQRALLEKKQQHIVILEGKVRELVREIKHLLHIDSQESHPPAARLDVSEEALLDSFLSATPSVTSFDLSVQLHRYIEKVEGLTGVDHLGDKQRGPRFLDLSLECYAVDRRRLFDVFKDEKIGIFFLYSLNEKKFLFASNLTKELLGMSPEKFIKEFVHLVVQGYSEWEEALPKVRKIKEVSTRLVILNKEHHQKPFECIMGKLSKGSFAHHVLGVLALT
jgi:hypothetical protein